VWWLVPFGIISGVGHTTLKNQIALLQKILFQNKQLLDVFAVLNKLEIPEWYVSGGTTAQIVWNYFHGFELNNNIKDYDIVYFYKEDLSEKFEKELQNKIRENIPGFPIQIDAKNEAGLHLWYHLLPDTNRKIEPYISVEHAISTFPTTASSVGVRYTKNKQFEVCAPRGLTDLLNMTVRANKVLITKDTFEKKSSRWKKAWPKLEVIPWEYK